MAPKVPKKRGPRHALEKQRQYGQRGERPERREKRVDLRRRRRAGDERGRELDHHRRRRRGADPDGDRERDAADHVVGGGRQRMRTHGMKG